MSEFLIVLAIAGFAGLLTYLGAPLAEKFEIPNRVGYMRCRRCWRAKLAWNIRMSDVTA